MVENMHVLEGNKHVLNKYLFSEDKERRIVSGRVCSLYKKRIEFFSKDLPSMTVSGNVRLFRFGVLSKLGCLGSIFIRLTKSGLDSASPDTDLFKEHLMKSNNIFSHQVRS